MKVRPIQAAASVECSVLAPYNLFKAAMYEVDLKMATTLLMLSSKRYQLDLRTCQKALRRKLTIVKARREMFQFKWSKLSF